MATRRNQRLASIAVLFILLTGCIHKTGGTVTPWERVTTDNAILAQSINTIEQGAEAAVNAGVLPKTTGASVIVYCGQAAAVHLQINAILTTAPNVSAADLTKVASLITQLGNSAAVLINSGQIGVKNPKSQALFTEDVQSVASLAKLLIQEIQAAKGGTQ